MSIAGTNSLNAYKLLRILERNTDQNYPRQREELLEDYEEEYGEAISESSFDRYIKAFNDFGIEILHEPKKGYYGFWHAPANRIYMLGYCSSIVAHLA